MINCKDCIHISKRYEEVLNFFYQTKETVLRNYCKDKYNRGLKNSGLNKLTRVRCRQFTTREENMLNYVYDDYFNKYTLLDDVKLDPNFLSYEDLKINQFRLWFSNAQGLREYIDNKLKKRFSKYVRVLYVDWCNDTVDIEIHFIRHIIEGGTVISKVM